MPCKVLGTMITSQFLKDQWTAIRATLKVKYPDLTDNDLAYILGHEETVFDSVQRRTGLTREEIERDLLEGMQSVAA